MPSLMNTKEAAEYLKLHYVTLYKLAQQGHIPASKIGGVWRFNKDILDRWLAQQSLGVLGNVLVVDDDPAILEMLSEIVSREGYKAVAVETGEKAIEESEKQPFDMIFLDLLLPGISGVEVLSTLKKMGRRASVVILTGYADDPIADAAMKMGPKFLLRKPFRVSEIIQAINSIGSSTIQEGGGVEGQQVLTHFLGPSRQRRRKKAIASGTGRPPEKEESSLRELLDQLPEIVFEVDIQGNVIYANRTAFESFGYCPEDIARGIDVLQMVGPEDRDKARGNIDRILSGEDVGASEYMVRRKDGGRFPAVIHATRITDDNGHAVGFRGIVIRLGVPDQLEEMLWESEEESRIIFDNIGDAIVVTDLSGRILKANDAAAKMLGLPDREHLAGRNAFEFIAARERPLGFKSLAAAGMEGVATSHIERVLLTAEGQEFNAEINISPLSDGSGTPTGFIAVARDITERKRTEETLRQSEEDYRTLFENTIDGMVVIYRQTMKVVLANETAIRMYGFDPSDNIEQIDLLDHVHPGDRESALKSLAEDMFEKDLRRVVEFRTLTRDGTVKWVSGLGTRIKYHGKMAGLVSFRDITAQRQAEDALRESEERFRLLVDSTQEMVQSVAPDGHFLFVNKTWHKTLGYTKKDVEILTLQDIIHPDSLEHCTHLFQKVLEGETVDRIEAVFKTKDGSEICVEGNASPRWLNSTIVGTMGFFREVPERKRKPVR